MDGDRALVADHRHQLAVRGDDGVDAAARQPGHPQWSALSPSTRSRWTAMSPRSCTRRIRSASSRPFRGGRRRPARATRGGIQPAHVDDRGATRGIGKTRQEIAGGRGNVGGHRLLRVLGVPAKHSEPGGPQTTRLVRSIFSFRRPSVGRFVLRALPVAFAGRLAVPAEAARGRAVVDHGPLSAPSGPVPVSSVSIWCRFQTSPCGLSTGAPSVSRSIWSRSQCSPGVFVRSMEAPPRHQPRGGHADGAYPGRRLRLQRAINAEPRAGRPRPASAPRHGPFAGTRMRTWFEANVTSPARTPGRPPSASRAIAVARDRPAPKRTTSSPFSREIDDTRSRRPGAARRPPRGGSRSWQRPEPVGDLLAERREVADRPSAGKSPVQLELLRLVRDVLVGQVRLDRQIDDRLQRATTGARPSSSAFCVSTASASRRE